MGDKWSGVLGNLAELLLLISICIGLALDLFGAVKLSDVQSVGYLIIVAIFIVGERIVRRLG